MTRSLRAKITLALLFTGLTSALLVGVIARAILLREFNEVVLENSFQAFTGDLTAYLQEYGSWEAAEQAERFPEFVTRRRESVPAPARDVGAGGAAFGARRGGGPPAEGPPGRGRGGPGGGRGGQAPGFSPNFFFIITDPAGNVLDAPRRDFAPGSPLPAELMEEARPISVRGQLVAYAVPAGQANTTQFDQSYLDAMETSMWYGVAGAGLLALALGFFFSGRLSANLRVLTGAIQAMGTGQLRQHVAVRSRDEVGFLAESFNRMSEQLQRSHDTIREQTSRLQELSIRDETTHLHNRRYFDEQASLAFAQAQRYSRPFTVAIGDIDHFKKINDGFSHATGDEVLRRVAAILAAGTRDTDIVARYGGEEFVIAFPETGLAEAQATCERIRRQIQDYAWSDIAPELRVTMTIGVDAEMARGRVEQMLAAADGRLYEGKQGGRNRVIGALEIGRTVPAPSAAQGSGPSESASA